MTPDEKQAKHLEFITGAINRMAANAFQLKAWSITVVSGLIALSAQSGKWGYAALGLVPAVAFWGLDAVYLRQERLFRKLFDAVRQSETTDIRYSMDTSDYARQVDSSARIARSWSVLWLHGALVLATLGVAVVMLIAQSHARHEGVFRVLLGFYAEHSR